MEAIALNATSRTVAGKQVKQLRAQGTVPAVVYGHGIDSRNLAVTYGEVDRAFRKAGESSLVDLAVDGATPVKVLIQDVQRDPLLDRILHVDFRQVNMKEKLEVEVILEFVGEAPAIKAHGAILVKAKEHLAVRCLPSDLVHEIKVELAPLANVGDMIRVSDLKVPAGLEVLDGAEEIVAVINEPISEAELAALESTPVTGDVAAVKVEAEEKKAERTAEKDEAAKA